MISRVNSDDNTSGDDDNTTTDHILHTTYYMLHATYYLLQTTYHKLHIQKRASKDVGWPRPSPATPSPPRP